MDKKEEVRQHYIFVFAYGIKSMAVVGIIMAFFADLND
jgi:hypothetical protein